jgi:tRNA(Arg) A34 adenosine deaminase TadA
MKTNVFKNEAINQCRKSSYKQRLGAVVVYKGKIVGKGCNKVMGTGKTRIDGFHAEIEAINNTPAIYRKNSTVYVCRINKIENIMMSKPCHGCETILRKLGVKYVWYSQSGEWKKMVL